MQISSITEEKIIKLQADIDMKEKTLENLKNTTEKEMWIKDLDEFLENYPKFEETLKIEEKKKRNKNIK
jgi:hypothetical protein